MPLKITVNPAGLAPGSYSGNITILAEGTTEQIAVTAVVSAGPAIAGVQNAGSGFFRDCGQTVSCRSMAPVCSLPVSWTPSTSLPATLGAFP